MHYPAPQTSSDQPWQQPYGQPPHVQPAWPGHGQPKAPSRNVGMIVGGAVLLVLALGLGVVVAMNLYQYLTIEDRWANDPILARGGGEWIVELIKRKALERVMLFGSGMGLFGVAGLVLGGLGLRKK